MKSPTPWQSSRNTDKRYGPSIDKNKKVRVEFDRFFGRYEVLTTDDGFQWNIVFRTSVEDYVKVIVNAFEKVGYYPERNIEGGDGNSPPE